MYVTFYSYKGGVGRTMALANIACLLAQDEDHPQRVLLLDLDLEAPGLHRLFPSTEEIGRGFVDLAYDFSKSGGNRLDIQDSIYTTKVSGIDVLPAGHVGSKYCKKLQSLYWPGFLTADPSERGAFFDALVSQINARQYDYILIDSRTGLSDAAGIATQLLPDLVLMIFRLTEQNLEGVAHLYATTKFQLAARGREYVQILPVASFVTSQSSSGHDKRRRKALSIFGTKHLSYVRFDPELVSEERLFSLKEVAMWPTPPILDDYRRLCGDIRRLNSKDTKTASRNLSRALQQGDPAKATSLIFQMLQSKPRLAKAWDALYEFGLCTTGRFEKFDELASSILERDPSNGFAHEWTASTSIAEAEEPSSLPVEDARDKLTLALLDQPHSVRLHLKLSEVQACLGDLQGACESVRKALTLEPSSVALRLRLAHLLIRRGRDYFISALDVLTEGGSDTIFPLVAYLVSYASSEAEAEPTIVRIAAQGLDWHRQQMHIAHCRAIQGRYEEAARLADEALSSTENEPDLSDMQNWAELLLCVQQYERAIELLDGMSQLHERPLPLLQLTRFLQTGGESGSIDEIRTIWRSNNWGAAWNFTELLFLRERLKESDVSDDGRYLDVFEELIRDSEFSWARHDSSSAFWRRAAIRFPNEPYRTPRYFRTRLLGHRLYE